MSSSIYIYIIEREREGPVEDIKADISTSVTDMAEIIGGNATDIHTNLAWNSRLEDLFLFRHTVIHLEFLLFFHFSPSFSTSLCYNLLQER